MAKLPDPVITKVTYVYVDDWEERQRKFFETVARILHRIIKENAEKSSS